MPRTPQPARLTLLFSGNAYYEFFPTLADRGIEVLGFDQRGWGRTCSALPPSNKGNTGSTVQVLSDISEIISSQLPSSIPLFLMGHSMGGGSTLTYAAHYPSSELSQIRGFLAESPFIGLDPAAQPSWLKVFVGRLASMVVPRKQLFEKLNTKLLSREIAVQQDVENDALCHNIGSLECFGGMLDRAADLETGRAKVEQGIKSLWIGHGTSDFVTSQPASKKWFEGCGVEDKEYKEYDGWYHKCMFPVFVVS